MFLSLYAHTDSIWHVPHFGLLAVQWYLPKSTSVLWSGARSSARNILAAFLSVSSGDFVLTIPIRFRTRCTWVSTQRNGAFSVTERNTFAVLIPTQGSFTSSSMVFGGSEWCSRMSISQVLWIFFALLLKNDTELMKSVISSIPIRIPSSGVMRWRKKFLLIIFTCLSVACADIRMAMRSWNSFSW